MNMADWEGVLYKIARSTGDPRLVLEYIKTVKMNTYNVRREELKNAQTEVYYDDGGGLTNN